MNLTQRLADKNPPRLCYIAHGYAYFTTLQDVTQQWGDDWDDTPYEHNAETPYQWNERMNTPRYEIFKYPFECVHLITPDEYDNSLNSSYSVKMINQKEVPWMQRPPHDHVATQVESIYAGTSFNDFVTMIHMAGGQVYTPIPKEDSK